MLSGVLALLENCESCQLKRKEKKGFVVVVFCFFGSACQASCCSFLFPKYRSWTLLWWHFVSEAALFLHVPGALPVKQWYQVLKATCRFDRWTLLQAWPFSSSRWHLLLCDPNQFSGWVRMGDKSRKLRFSLWKLLYPHGVFSWSRAASLQWKEWGLNESRSTRLMRVIHCKQGFQWIFRSFELGPQIIRDRDQM